MATSTTVTTNSITLNNAPITPKCTHVLFDFDGTLVNSIDRIIEVVDQLIQRENPSLRITEKIKGSKVQPNVSKCALSKSSLPSLLTTKQTTSPTSPPSRTW